MARAALKQHEDEDQEQTGTNIVTLPNTNENKKKIKDFVERIEELDDSFEKLRAQKAILMKEAVDAGMDRKILKKIIKLRKLSENEKETEAELTKFYASAVQLKLPFEY